MKQTFSILALAAVSMIMPVYHAYKLPTYAGFAFGERNHIISIGHPGKEEFLGRNLLGQLVMKDSPDLTVFKPVDAYGDSVQIMVQVLPGVYQCIDAGTEMETVSLQRCFQANSKQRWRLLDGTLRSQGDGFSRCLTVQSGKRLRMEACGTLNPSQMFMAFKALSALKLPTLPSIKGLRPYFLTTEIAVPEIQWKEAELVENAGFQRAEYTGLVLYRRMADMDPTLSSQFQIVLDWFEQWCVEKIGKVVRVKKCRTGAPEQMWRSTIVDGEFMVQSMDNPDAYECLYFDYYSLFNGITGVLVECNSQVWNPTLAFIPAV